MIVEALTHLFTPAPTYVKKMGYLKESIAIESRAQRCKNAWKPHLDNCKKLILEQAKKLSSSSQIMILGSGGFHDVPAKELTDLGHSITAVDIVHLPKIKNRYPHFAFESRDVTGLNEHLFKAIKCQEPLPLANIWTPSTTPDLIISLNLLSQLPLKMTQYAEKHSYDLNKSFHKDIMKAHLEWLKKQKTNVLLISDIQREYYHQDELVEMVSVLSDITLPSPNESWQWNIAPKGEADSKITIAHQVGGWIL